MTEARLSFIVDYEDPQAGITRKYQLCYYVTDNTIEMHDIRNRRLFLKRCQYPQLKPADLFIDATISIYARKLRVVGFADDATEIIYLQYKDTLCVIPPENIESLGRVLSELADAGIRIKSMNMLSLSASEAAEFAPGISSSWGGQPLVALEVVFSSQADGDHKEEKYCPGLVKWFDDASYFFGSGSARRDRSSATIQDCTLGIIKPHAVEKFGGQIIDLILSEGFQISALRLVTLDKADSADFLEVYKGVVPEYTQLAEQLSSAPCWVMEVKGEKPVEAFRQLCGPHDPEVGKVLRPNSIRAMFGTSRVCNAIHCTDLAEDGVLESDFFFNLLRPVSS